MTRTDGVETELNTRVADAFIDMLRCLGSLGSQIGAEYGLHGSDAMALHKLDHPVTMKEFAQALGCDASFVTLIADSLERRGLARREPSLQDRRRKNLVLTEKGNELRDQIVRETAQRMPWASLDKSERECLLSMLVRMVETARRGTSAASTGQKEGGVPVTPAAVTSS
jgi:DNA-binding MarR family transcriptional regulator